MAPAMGGMPAGPAAGPGISFEKLPGKKQVLWSDEKLAGPINPDSLDMKKQKVDRTLAGKNPNVGYAPDNWMQRKAGTAGHALDPLSNEPMTKGKPVAAQSNSPAAQFGRRLGVALEPTAPRISKQKLAGKNPPKGPHALTLKGEAHETRAMERAESPAFEKAERRMGIEGKYAKPMKKKGKK